MSQNLILKTAAAIIVLIAAITRIVMCEAPISNAIDKTTLLYIVVAFMMIVIPWDRLKSFKAGSFEVDVSQLKDTQRRLENVTEDVAGLVNRVEQALIPIIGGKNPHQVERLQKDKQLIIGSKEFPEQIIFGHLLANWIKEKVPGVTCIRAIPNGGTLKNWADLTNGWIDGYVEYTGTGGMLLQHDLRGKPIAEAIKELNTESEHQGLNIEWLRPLGLSNDYVIAIRAKNAKELGVSTLKDLKKRGIRKLSFCCQMEFFNRPDGLSRLQRLYDVQFENIRIVSYADRYRLLDEGSYHVTAGFRTDPEFQELLQKSLLIELKDTHHFFPEYVAVPVFSKEALSKVPGLEQALLEMQDILKDKNMSALIERFEDKLRINDEFVCSELTKDIIKFS